MQPALIFSLSTDNLKSWRDDLPPKRFSWRTPWKALRRSVFSSSVLELLVCLTSFIPSFDLKTDILKGMSCAHHLAQHPEKFDVTVVDAVNFCGGQAYSIPIDKKRYGAGWLNQGVQGGFVQTVMLLVDLADESA